MDRPNVLFVVFDTARADVFEPWGAPPGTTPTVAQLAADGGAPAVAVSTSSWTVPAHVGMFTGGYARSMGLGQAPGGTANGVADVLRGIGDAMLPTVLQQAGWATRGYSCNAWISPSSGFDTGFDDFQWFRSSRGSAFVDGRLRGQVRWLLEALLARVDDGAEAVETAFAADLAEPTSAPRFWFVNLVECHSPYLPPRPHVTASAYDRVQAARDMKLHYRIENIWKACLTGPGLDEVAMARLRGLYDDSIGALDAWLARMLDRLDRAGLLDDTIVIVTSDHGENFGEGGLVAHTLSLDDRLVRVPFVWRGPDRIELPDVVSTRDLPAMLETALGLPADTFPRRNEPGVAVAQLDPLLGVDDPRLESVTADWQLDTRGVRLLSEPMTAATDGRWKLVRHGDELVAHDLLADPLELVGLDASRAPRALHAALARPDVVATGSGEPVRSDTATDDVAALEEQMRLLGYM